MSKEEELAAKIREVLPADVQVKIERIESWLTIKPSSFLGSDTFAKLQARVKELGGSYVSAWKMSHFRILLDVREQSLQEWYKNQKIQSETLPLPISLNLNVQVTTPEQLVKLLEVVKKHVGPPS